MNGVLENLNKSEVYIKIKEILQSNSKITDNKINISATGLPSSAKAMLVYAITKETKKSSLVVCNNIFEVNKFIQDVKFFSDDIEVIFLPSEQIEYYDIDKESNELDTARAYAIEKILDGKLNIVVTTIDSLLLNMKNKKEFSNKEFSIKVSESIDIEKIQKELVLLGYQRTENVEGKGQFAIRGGIIDIFTVNNELPYRIELFGDEVDNIRTFDVISQRSIDTVKEVKVSLASTNNITENQKEYIINGLKTLVEDESINSDLKLNILKDIEKIENSNLENLFDKYYYFFQDESETLLDYTKEYNIYINEPVRCIEKAKNVVYENEEELKSFASKNYLYMPYANRYKSFEEIEVIIKKLNLNSIYLEKITTDIKLHDKRKIFDLEGNEENFYRNSLETLDNDLKRRENLNKILVFPSQNRIESIKNYLQDKKLDVEVLNGISSAEHFKKDKVYITFGILSSGFCIKEFDILVIAESVSGTNILKKKNRSENKNIGEKINTFEDLNIGDYLVHENHGIGRYRGRETVQVEDVFKDYIKIEYEKGAAIYVPINQLDLVKKYICDDDTIPKLNTLGTKEWSVTKRKVSEHVNLIAKELVALYAKREQKEGFAFPKDTPWQKEFEDAFEYELTLDQAQAVKEIKEDMEIPRPMDRLLCGDVGYGKTEVALRAAFKAVMGGKQVAYLVPTTVLSLQQYRTFKERMEDFGIKVEMLSRFKTRKEQTEILKKLVDGKIDVIVGTHRLLSKDVFFKDLGLLIIDEEHRFGVKAKETIKMLKETIDVLSMTATPIPRTLHMSMVGIRGMSTLTEPPVERLPIHTYVVEYDENVIQNAIEKELDRDGQVFYINNRIDNIEGVAEKVRSLVPYAKVAFAHGRMEPKQIEDIMLSFINHEIDILVCTTILESGIDIPNANTIIIENADKLGLAQLYQIRGRVGRSSKLAYAYVTYKKDKILSEVSEKRLKAIKDFTEFGSGFKIALRDLEIRGAGNLLGKEQHRTYGKSWI